MGLSPWLRSPPYTHLRKTTGHGGKFIDISNSQFVEKVSSAVERSPLWFDVLHGCVKKLWCWERKWRENDALCCQY